MTWLGMVTWFPGFVLVFTYAPLLFPDGRLPSGRWRPVAWISAVPLALFALEAAWLWPHRERQNPERFSPDGPLGTILDASYPLALLCGLACVASVAVRFWGSRGVQRQQIKWFAYAIAVTLSAQILSSYLLDGPAGALLMLLAAPLVPTAMGIAVLRYRLYDIGVIINRTLVYGSLTATLVALYVVGIVVLQRVFVAVAGHTSTLAVVVSTLAIAALFNPLRRRIQEYVDRRFYRSKYDARKTLEAFSTKLRDETDLETLNDDLVGVVAETMQPAHVGLWLRHETGAKRGER